MDDTHTRFRRIFANLPSKLRNEDIIVVIDDKPYTWNSAYFEVNNNTGIGKRILKKLEEMKII